MHFHFLLYLTMSISAVNKHLGPTDIINITKVWNSYWWTISSLTQEKERRLGLYLAYWELLWFVFQMEQDSNLLHYCNTLECQNAFTSKASLTFLGRLPTMTLFSFSRSISFSLSWCLVKMFFFLDLGLLIIVLFLCTLLNNSPSYFNLSKMSRWLLCSLPSLSFCQAMHILYPLFSLLRLILLFCKLFQLLFSKSFSSKIVSKSKGIRCPNISSLFWTLYVYSPTQSSQQLSEAKSSILAIFLMSVERLSNLPKFIYPVSSRTRIGIQAFRF